MGRKNPEGHSKIAILVLRNNFSSQKSKGLLKKE